MKSAIPVQKSITLIAARRQNDVTDRKKMVKKRSGKVEKRSWRVMKDCFYGFVSFYSIEFFFFFFFFFWGGEVRGR